MKPYRLIPHTADIGIEVEGADLAEVLERAAYGLLDVIADLERVEPRERETVALPDPPPEDEGELLVRWLEELLYRFETERRLFCRFRVDPAPLAAGPPYAGFRAEVEGEPVDPARHAFKTAVKAITYHELEVGPKPSGGYGARVILDL